MTVHQNCAKCTVVPGFGSYLLCCVSDGAHFPVERKMIWYSLVSAAALGLVTFLAYRGFLSDLPGFGKRVGYLLPYLVLALSGVAGVVWHFKAVRREVGDMVGMMIGMTFGMIAGFLAGYFVGATNGMFTGSIFGMIVGMGLGWYVGDCCAMMGRMEGLMAGLMGGVMGAMTAVMLLNDRIRWFTPLLIIACVIILAGLTYLIHKEHRTKYGIDIKFTGAGLGRFFSLSFLVMVLTVAAMVYGPKSFLFL